MRKELFPLVQQVQAAMEAEARGSFSEDGLESLRVLIGLTMEFADELEHPYADWPEHLRHRYLADSTFAGISFFTTLVSDCRCRTDAVASEINLGNVEDVLGEFRRRYAEFLKEIYFGRRCCLLLDLFKLQIAFAGLVY